MSKIKSMRIAAIRLLIQWQWGIGGGEPTLTWAAAHLGHALNLPCDREKAGDPLVLLLRDQGDLEQGGPALAVEQAAASARRPLPKIDGVKEGIECRTVVRVHQIMQSRSL